MTEALEPEDKLDATTNVVVNGPEDAPFDWHAIDWRRVEDDVRRLRQRIFTASRAGDLKRVRSLQKLMLRSRANTLVSVRRVTERNAGRLTAGVEGEVALTPEAKAKLAEKGAPERRAAQGLAGQAGVHPEEGQQNQTPSARNPRDFRQVPSGHGSSTRWSLSGRRGSSRGPTGSGRAAAAMTRSKRSTSSSRADARNDCWRWTQIWPGRSTASPTTTFWPCSARSPPGGMVKQWLKAGVVEQGRLHRTEEGTPQGGVVSRVLLNVALHGMEQVAGVRYDPNGWVRADSPVLIRYADDLVRHEAPYDRAEMKGLRRGPVAAGS
jgi:RNA-directed DNA polymerase